MSDSESGLRRQPFDSLATKIILFVFASTFATALVVSWTSIQSTYDSLLGTINHIYPVALDHSSQRLEPWLAEAGREAESLAGRASRGRNLDAALETAPKFEALISLDANGAVAASAGLPRAAVPLEAVASLSGSEPGLRLLPFPDGSVALAAWVPPDATRRNGLLALLKRDAIRTLLESELPEARSTFLLVAADGRVVLNTGSATARSVIDLDAVGSGREVSEYDVGDVRVIGLARELEPVGWSLLVETPFEAAFAPVLSVVTRVFITDLCVILLFSFLAYRVTATVVRPIERLSDGARRIAQGQIDLEIPQSNRRDEVGLLTRTFNDMMEQLRRNQWEIETANQHLTDRNERLQQANEVLSQLSITDGLTKLHNHRFFQDHLTREIKRVGRSREPLAMLMIDLDDFKQLNDRFGHAAGDELLSRVAGTLSAKVRDTDLLARYGGEEFVILAANTDTDGAYLLAEKIRTSIAESSFILDDSMRPQRVTVSIGVAQFGGSRKHFFQAADQALYRAKATGKDCVVVAASPSETA